MKTTQRISEADLYRLIVNARPGVFATMICHGHQRSMRKIFGCDPQKVEYVQIQIGCNYKRLVDKALSRAEIEADFKSNPLTWGQWDVLDKTITHKGETYLSYYPGKNPAFKGWCHWTINGIEATPDEVAMIESKQKEDAKESRKQADLGLTRPQQVKPRTKNLRDIIEFNIGGINYIVKH